MSRPVKSAVGSGVAWLDGCAEMGGSEGDPSLPSTQPGNATDVAKAPTTSAIARWRKCGLGVTDADDTGDAIEAAVEAQDAVDLVALHHRHVQGVAGGQARGRDEQPLRALHVR